jgi:hypothetical protein
MSNSDVVSPIAADNVFLKTQLFPACLPWWQAAVVVCSRTRPGRKTVLLV